MHPPAFVCKRLYELDPEIRLAWLGFRPRYEGELNAGTFCIVQLWKRDHFGTHERPQTPSESWYVRPGIDENGREELVRIDRGPVFNRKGGTRPDWNVLAHEVIYKMNLKDFGISTEDVVSGAVLGKIDRFYRPLKDRIEEDEREAIADMKRLAAENGREAGMRLHRALNQHDITYNPVPYEDVRKELMQREANREHRDVARIFR